MSDGWMEKQVNDPQWEPNFRWVHDWQAYATDELKENWHSIDPKVRAMIVRALDEIASNEHWD